ncbi:hypothetical protein [Natrarchaeobius halalkaliphilus]|nr:hypothetical protein [Natrarchaeobius halalkaliphilus]
MSSERETADASSDDTASGLVCGRCDDPIRRDRVIRLSTEPCPELAERYEPVAKPYCSDCIAAIGMLAFATHPRSRCPTSRVARDGR